MKIIDKEIIYQGWSTLTKYLIPFIQSDGQEKIVSREIFDSGNGATALLYNPEKETIVLTKQFRLAAYVEGHQDGKFLEACAGMLDNLHPEEAIKKEILEETGYLVKSVQHLFHAYATPGAHMERVEYFLAEYNDQDKVNEGGGLDNEHEDIEVIEMSYQEIKKMLSENRIEDAKTIILLQYAILQGIIT